MEVALVLTNLQSLKKKNYSEALENLNQLVDLLTKKKLPNKSQLSVLLLVELLRASSCVKDMSKVKTEQLEDNLPSYKEALKQVVRILRPGAYLLAMILFGKKSWKAFLVCVGLDLLGGRPSWEMYLFRFPLFHLLILKLVPKFMRAWAENYQSYVSYII